MFSCMCMSSRPYPDLAALHGSEIRLKEWATDV